MSITVINPNVHVVRDTPAARLFRKALRCEDILTFFHLETGQWVLAYWINKLGRAVDEIEDLGEQFENLSRSMVIDIVTCWGPIDWQKKKKKMIARERDRIRKANDEVYDSQERWDWSKKRLKGQIPFAHG